MKSYKNMFKEIDKNIKIEDKKENKKIAIYVDEQKLKSILNIEPEIYYVNNCSCFNDRDDYDKCFGVHFNDY